MRQAGGYLPCDGKGGSRGGTLPERRSRVGSIGAGRWADLPALSFAPEATARA